MPLNLPPISLATQHSRCPRAVAYLQLGNDLWLPPEYGSKVVAVHERTVALGLDSGVVIFLSFDFSRERPWEDMAASIG
jgi:hypothetical protein